MSRSRLIVVQARAGSTRLPGKVLMPLGGMPMLAFQLQRLRSGNPNAGADDGADLGARIVVATSDLPGDDAVAAAARAVGVDVVRGPEADVLGRYALALATHPATTVVRLTGDCPLTDPAIVRAAIDLHETTGADYTSNVLPRSFPKGLDVEVISSSALAEIEQDAIDPADREHVTPFLYRHPRRFRLANLHSGDDCGEEWWTVDTAEDLERIRSIVGRLDVPITAGWQQILATVGRTSRPRPGVVLLRPRPGPEPGSAPWVRTWSAELDGATLGLVSVTAGDGHASRVLDVPDQHRLATEAALDALLVGDQQARA